MTRNPYLPLPCPIISVDAAKSTGVAKLRRGKLLMHELVAAGGVYAGLYESWLGNTQRSRAGAEPTTDS